MICMTLGSGLRAQDASLTEIRQLYQEASKTRKACERLFRLLPEEGPQIPAIMLGYRGCAHMIMASHLYSPVGKLNEFSTGKGLLEKALKKEPLNTELIYLRYTVQVNAPSFLGYKKQMSGDCAFLRDHVSSLGDKQLQQSILQFLKAHPCL